MLAGGLDCSLFASLISDPEMLPFRHCARQPHDHSLSEKIGNWHAYWGTGHHYVNVRFRTCLLSNFHQHIPEPLPPRYRSPRLINQVSSRFAHLSLPLSLVVHQHTPDPAMPMAPAPSVLFCFARRDKGHLWYLVNFPSPASAILPCTPTTTSLLSESPSDWYAEDGALSWWAHEKPYIPFVPVAGNDPAMRCVLRNGSWDSDIRQCVQNGWYKVAPFVMNSGQRVVDHISEVIFALKNTPGIECQPPPAPTLPNDTWRQSHDTVAVDIQRFRRECREIMGYIVFVLKTHENLRLQLPSSDTQHFIAAVMELGCEGVAFDPFEAGCPSKEDVESWTKFGVPFAYVWSHRHSNSDEVRQFNPRDPETPWKLQHPGHRPPQVCIAVERRGFTEGVVLPTFDAQRCHGAYRHEDFKDDFLCLNYRVFFLDRPIQKDGKAIKYSPLFSLQRNTPEYFGEFYEYRRLDREPQAMGRVPSVSTTNGQSALTTPPTMTMLPTPVELRLPYVTYGLH